jgi:AcrR family transcriptional regulator
MTPTPASPSRRERILAAALEVFLEHGLAGAPVEEICGRSGASVGSVYHHFGSKEGLAGAVYEAALSGYQSSFLAALEEHPADAEAGVRAMVAAHLRWCLLDRPDLARFLLFHGDAARGTVGTAVSGTVGTAASGTVGTAARGPVGTAASGTVGTATGGGLDAANRAFFRRVSAWWKTHVAYGALRELDFDLAYALLLGPSQEYCRLSLTGRTTIPPDRAEPVLADGAWLALTA